MIKQNKYLHMTFVAICTLCQSQLHKNPKKQKKATLKDQFANWDEYILEGLCFKSCVYSPFISYPDWKHFREVLTQHRCYSGVCHLKTKINNTEHLPEKLP